VGSGRPPGSRQADEPSSPLEARTEIPLAAAVALRNLEIFERDGVLENVRALEPHLQSRMEELRSVPIVGDVRGRGFFWAVELVRDEDAGRFDAAERDRLLRGFLPGRLLEAGIIARADEQHAWVLADDERGTFGDYPPAV